MKKSRKILSLLLSIAMLAGMLSTNVFAFKLGPTSNPWTGNYTVDNGKISIEADKTATMSFKNLFNQQVSYGNTLLISADVTGKRGN